MDAADRGLSASEGDALGWFLGNLVRTDHSFTFEEGHVFVEGKRVAVEAIEQDPREALHALLLQFETPESQTQLLGYCAPTLECDMDGTHISYLSG